MIAARPLAIADIFDHAVTLAVRRWRTAVAITLLASPPLTLYTAFDTNDRPGSPQADALGTGFFLLGIVTLIFAVAALTRLFASGDQATTALALYRAVLRSFWRLLSVALITGVLTVVVFGVAVFAFLMLPRTNPFLTLALMFVIVAACVPILFVLELAFTDAVLEGTRAIASVAGAFRRALSRDQRVRTVKLAYAAALCYFGPKLTIVFAAAWLAVLTGQPWIAAAAVPLQTAADLVLFVAVMTVAATDYRVRKHGIDLDAALDARVAPA